MSEELLGVSIIQFLEAEGASVRLKNGIGFGTRHGRFPLKTVGELIHEMDKIDFYLRTIPNVGAKTTSELKRLAIMALWHVQRISVEPHTSESASSLKTSETDLGSAVGLTLAQALERCNDRERDVISCRFGLTGEPTKTLAEIGEIYNLSRERIRQLESKVLKQLAYRCRSAILLSLASRTDALWKRITEDSEVLRRDQELEHLKRLTPYETFEITVAFGSFEGWLRHVAKKTKYGWIAKHIDPAMITETLQAIGIRFSSAGEPDQLAHYVAKCGTSSNVLIIALTLAKNFRNYYDYVVSRPITRRIRRAIHAHLLRCWQEAPIPISLHELHGFYVAANPQDPCSTRDLSIVMTGAPHLFLNMYEEGWVAIGPRGVDVRDISDAENREAISEASKAQLDNQETGSRLLKNILESRGPLIFEELREYFLANKGYASGSVGPLLLVSDDFVRLAPGMYGLRTHLNDPRAIAQGKRQLLNARQCEFYCRARWAEEPRGLYPLWSYEMEYEWAVWARKNGVSSLLGALLSVSEPQNWPIDLDEQSYWKRLAGRLGLFQIEEPITVPIAATKPTLTEFVGAALLARVRGGVSWISLNRIRGARIDDRHSHTLLALLIALGVIEPARHWQERHPFIEESSRTVDALIEQLSESGSRKWTRDALEMITTAFVREKEMGWIDADDVTALIDELMLSVSDKGESHTTKATASTPNGSASELDQLIALVRRKRAIATIAEQPAFGLSERAPGRDRAGDR